MHESYDPYGSCNVSTSRTNCTDNVMYSRVVRSVRIVSCFTSWTTIRIVQCLTSSTTRTDRLYLRVVRSARIAQCIYELYDPYGSSNVFTSCTTRTERPMFSRVVRLCDDPWISLKLWRFNNPYHPCGSSYEFTSHKIFQTIRELQ